MCESIKFLITQAILQLQAIATIKRKMQKLSSTLPEYDTVVALYGVGEVLAPQSLLKLEILRKLKISPRLFAKVFIL